MEIGGQATTPIPEWTGATPERSLADVVVYFEMIIAGPLCGSSGTRCVRSSVVHSKQPVRSRASVLPSSEPPPLSVVPKPVKNHMILCLGKVGCDGTLNLVKKFCVLGKAGLVSDPSEYLFAIYKSCDTPDSSLRKRLCGGHVCVQKYQ